MNICWKQESNIEVSDYNISNPTKNKQTHTHKKDRPEAGHKQNQTIAIQPNIGETNYHKQTKIRKRKNPEKAF